MFSGQEGTLFLALAEFVFFAGISLLYLTANRYPRRDWARLAVGISAAILAIAALFVPALLGS